MAFPGLNGRLLRVIERFGYEEPTPIQRVAIPKVLSGAHVLITAPTGSGKTEAAVFPVLSKILDEEMNGGVAALYITPMRALNRDIHVRLREIAEELGIKVGIRHGDTPPSERRRQALDPPQLLITTPESFQFILVARRLRRGLVNVRWVIVDEIHELMNDKRGIQLAVGLERLVELAGEFQRIGLSATVGNVELASSFLGGVGRNVEVVSAGGPRDMVLEVNYPEPRETPIASELGISVEAASRLEELISFIHRHRSVLVFTNTRDEAELLGNRLRRILGDVVGVYHGSLSREERERLEEDLRSGRVRVVVSTSSLELGIDIGLIDAVVQYMSPRQVVRLIQRVGRSGHRAAGTSVGLIIASSLDDYIESLVIGRRALSGELEKDVEYHEGALDVLHHQVAGVILDKRIDGGYATIDDVVRIVTRAHPYASMARSKIMEIIKFMEERGYVTINEDRLVPRRGLHRYYFENASMIPDENSYVAIDMASKRPVGELDEEFVATTEEGSSIILGGRVWRIVKIEAQSSRVFLEPIDDVTSAVPAWLGEEIPVPREVAEEACNLRLRLLRSLRIEEELREYPGGNRGNLVSELKKQLDSGIVPEGVTVEYLGRSAVIHVCLGSKGNEALGLYMSRFISNTLGAPVAYRVDPYRVYLNSTRVIPKDYIVRALMNTDPELVLKDAVLASKLFRFRFIHVARRFGVIPKGKLDVNLNKLVDAFRDSLITEETLREILVDKLSLKDLLDVVGRIGEVKIHEVKEYSPLALPIVTMYGRLDFTVEGMPRSMLVDLVRRRIMEREITLLCVKCGWFMSTRVRYVNEASCPRCGMRVIAVLKHGEDPRRIYDIVRRAKRGLPLSEEERRKWEEIRLGVSAVNQYGRYAIIALSAHGIGPSTVIRKVLSRVKSEEELYVAILEAEREFLRTREFWDT